MTDQRQSTDFNVLVGQNIAAARKAAGLSQADLARELSERGHSFQQQTILKVEKGSRPLRLEETVAIAGLLGVEVNDLLRTEEGELAAAQERVMVLKAQTARLEEQLAIVRHELDHAREELDVALMNETELRGRRDAARLKAIVEEELQGGLARKDAWFADQLREVAADSQDDED